MKKQSLQRIVAASLFLILLFGLCACSSVRKKSSEQAYPTPYPESAPYPTSAPYVNTAYEDAYEAAAYEYDGESGLAAYAAPAAGARAEEKESDVPEENPEKIIYSSDVTVETIKFEETVGKIDGLVKAYSAWIESSSISGSNYYQKSRGNASLRSASYTLRVPSERFHDLMESLSELGNVPYSHIYTQNVTAQYYDTSARLKAYRTQEARLLEMMELAETVEDVIIIEDRLTELRYEIESLQSNLNNWDRRVSYSTISLSIKEVQEYTPEVKVDPTYGEELLKALKDGLSNAGEFLKNLLLLLAELLPVLIVLIPIFWLLIRRIKRLFRKVRSGKLFRKKEKAPEKQESTEEKS